MRKEWIAAIAAAAVTAVGAQSADATWPTPQPYGTNDSGGFRNVLPPGENGLDNVFDLAGFGLFGTRPAHSNDQQPLYDGLLKASPTLTDSGVSDFFKDATFGVAANGQASSISPRLDVTITRDKAYGVPHIYGRTREGVAFGAGYAAAQDRLFLMDVLRHTGRAQLSSFVGGSASNRQMDRDQWTSAPYTEADLQSQIDAASRLYGERGEKVQRDLDSYVAGINAYITRTRLDLTKLPAEYAGLLKLPEYWKGTDVVAISSLIGGLFGKGGGREVDSAKVAQSFTDRFGSTEGRAAWKDFRSKEDPEAPVTLKDGRFPYETDDAFSPRGLAMPDRGSVQATPVAPPVGGAAAASTAPKRSAPGRFAHLGDQLRRALSAAHASNWELVSKRESASGHAIGVMGPQVGYYVPQILMEEDLHGPGIDARGAAFPGANLYVQLGHGRDYGWSATTALSDNVDTFAEVLCGDDGLHYRYKGRCLAMERLDRTNKWTPNIQDQTPAGSETLTIYRTVHGLVYARGTVQGKKVAFARARTTYFHEPDSVIGFSALNDPGTVRDPQSFQRAVSDVAFGFNWGYVDADHIAYYQSGWFPRRSPKTSPDFPVLGTGEYDWTGFDPATRTQSLVPFGDHPQAVDPPFLVSWNNKPARGWAAADDQYGYGSVARSQMIEDRVADGTRGDRRITAAQLVQSMEEPATEDLRATKVLGPLLEMIGTPEDQASRDAVELLRGWAARGGHRRDLDGDGHYDDDRAVTVMDAWWPKLVGAEFAPTLGDGTYEALSSFLPIGDSTGGAPRAPDFFSGWWGYVSKDLRGLLRPATVAGRYSRSYCGDGSLSRCRTALRASLRAALAVPAAQLYGTGACAKRPEAACFDMNRSTQTTGIPVPDFPFQNRPTFQQVVQPTRRLDR